MATELASGFINLTVKYGDGMKQINKDLLGLDQTATKAGTDAGKSLTAALTKSAKIDTSAAQKAFAPLQTQAKKSGTNAFQEFMIGFRSGRAQAGGAGGKDLFGGLIGKAKSGGTSAATNFVEGMGGPLAAIGTKAGPIGLALTAAVGLGLAAGGLLGKQIMAGLEKDQASRNFAASLGLTPEQGKKAAAVAGKAYANNFGDSVQSNMDVAKAAIQSGLASGVNDPNLQKTIEQIQAVATTTGQTSEDVIRGAGQMVKTGMAKSVTGAMDLITKAGQKGLDVNGDLIDTLNEYGTQFRKLGIDGPTALGAIGQLLKGGARDADVAADALKEFSIRAIDGSKSTTDAYQSLGLDVKATTEAIAAGGPAATQMSDTVIDKLRAIQDPVERNRIGVELFGTQWEDLGGAINSLDLSTAVSEFGNVDGAAQKASDTLSGTGSSIESAKRNVEIAVDQMQVGLADAFGPALKQVSDWVVGHKDDILGFFTDLGHFAINAGDFVLDGMGQIVQGIGQVIEPIGDIQGAILKFEAWQADIRGDHETAAQLREQSEAAFGWGEGLDKAGQAMRDFDPSNMHAAMDKTKNDLKAAADNAELLKNGIIAIPGEKNVILKDTTDENIQRVKDLGYEITHLPNGQVAITFQMKYPDGTPIPPEVFKSPGFIPAVPGETQRPKGGGRARGGRVDPRGIIRGPGSGTSDSILARVYGGDLDWINVSAGEGIANEKAVQNGWSLIDALNKGWVPSPGFVQNMMGFGTGGQIPLGNVPMGPDSNQGPYRREWGKSDRKPLLWPWAGHYPGARIGGGASDPGNFSLPPGWAPNPDDLLFPEFVPPGQRDRQEEIWKRRHPRIKPFLLGGLLGFKKGGLLGPSVGSEANLQSNSVLVARSVTKLFPEIKDIGGYRPNDPYPWHPSGRAVDIMIPGGDTQNGKNPDGKALGDEVYAYLSANRDALGIENLLWQTLTGGNHFNHIHVQVKDTGGPAKPGSAYKLVGSRGGKGGGSSRTISLSDLSDDSSKEDVAAAIVGEGQRRGYSDDEIRAVLATAIGESGLRPGVTNEIGRHGLFQQDEGYSGRNTAGGQIGGFFDRLEGSKGSDIYARITGVQKGGYDRSWIKQYEDQAGQLMDDVSAYQSTTDDVVSQVEDTTGGSDQSDNPFAQIMSGFGQLADVGVGGLKESFLPPGFSDPQEWGITKIAAGLLKFGGGLATSAENALATKEGRPANPVLGSVLSALGGGLSGDMSGAFSSLIPPMATDSSGQIVFGSPGQSPEAFQSSLSSQSPGGGFQGIPSPPGVGAAAPPPISSGQGAGPAPGPPGSNNVVFQNNTFGNKPESVVKQASYNQRVNQKPQLAQHRTI